MARAFETDCLIRTFKISAAWRVKNKWSIFLNLTKNYAH
mgnify:CR=1 FL=1